ncbi:MAG TPA: amidase [Pyrinomonadaceae bacterium]|nr:amidase [Pyrinomonadaceae bacterium]
MSQRRFTRRQMLSTIAAASAGAIVGSIGCTPSKRTEVSFAGDLTQLDLAEAAHAVKHKQISPVELTKACLERIDRLDKQLNSFITVTPEEALRQAKAAEDLVMKGGRFDVLLGIPIAIKDNVDTAGILTTAASGVFANRRPSEDAEVVRRLRAAGAVILGKLNMHEFALGTTSAISHYRAVHNPWSPDHVAGGSSGGSAAAVAAGLCFGAVGTDTGGSVRIPASCCGIVGLKPSFGVVSAAGTIPVSKTFDHVGPMCRTVTDIAWMFRTMTDHPSARDFDPGVQADISGLRIGILKTSGDVCDSSIVPEVRASFDEAVKVIRSLGGVITEVELPIPDLGGIIDYESYAFHAEYLKASPGLYDERTRKTIISGSNVSEGQYQKLMAQIEKHRISVASVFENVDAVIVPTLPGLPIAIKDAVDPFALDACTFGFSIAGVPSISVPCGFSSSGLPIGLLIGGPVYSEGRVLRIASAYEKAAGWKKRRPPI